MCTLVERIAVQNLSAILVEASLWDLGVIKHKGSSKNRNNLSRSKKQRVLQLDPFCRYCLVARADTVDHVIPLSKGGSNDLSNLVGCCDNCNQKKADMSLEQSGMILHHRC